MSLPSWESLRKPQQECLEALQQAWEDGDEEAWCQMWCGVGKTLVYFMAIPMLGLERVVLVVPSLALVRQVKHDYIDAFGLSGDWDVVCSEAGSEFTSAVDYIDSGAHVLTTYASLGKIEAYFDLAIFDEAHHAKEDAEFDGAAVCWYFSATLPQDTPLLYSYNFADAIRDGFAQDFCIEVFVRPASKEASLPQLLHDLAKETGNNKLLVFTRFAETEEHSVHAWVDDNAMAFRDRDGWLEYLTGKTPPRDRARILREFEEREDWSVLASCKVLAEGVDTRGANALLFADPKTSRVQILQNVGRITRKKEHERPATIIVPIFVDREKYTGTCEEVSAKLEEEMKLDDGDYRPLLNVLAVLREEVPNWEASMGKPRGSGSNPESSNSVPKEYPRLNIHIDKSLEILWTIEGNGELLRQLHARVMTSGISPEEKAIERALRLRTFFNSNGHLPKYKAEDVQERKLYQWFMCQKMAKAGIGNWKCYDVVDKCLESFLGDDWSKTLTDEVREEKAMETARELRIFFLTNQRLPKSNAEGEKQLAQWLYDQKRISRGRVTQRNYYQAVHKFLESFLGDDWSKTVVEVREERAMETARDLRSFFITNRRLPKKAKDPNENRLAIWLGDQKRAKAGTSGTKHYDAVGTYLASFLGDDWSKILDDEVREENAMETASKFKQFFESCGRLPRKNKEDADETYLARWLSCQKEAKEGKRGRTYYTSVDNFLAGLLGKDWHRRLDDGVREERAMETARELRNFFLTNRRLPKHGAKDRDEKRLLTWLCGQKKAKVGKGSCNYYESVDNFLVHLLGESWHIIRDKDVRESSAMETAEELRRFFVVNRRLPKNIKDEKILARWLAGQRNTKAGKGHGVYYASVDQFLSGFLGGNWSAHCKRKSSQSFSTDEDTASISSHTTDSSASSDTTRLVKRPRLSVDPVAKFAGLSRDELIQRLTKHQQRGKYPAEAREDDADKRACNDKFVEAASASTDGLVVFLDSPALYTTRRLIDAGISLDRMVCPQLDADEYEAMKDWPHVRAGSLRSIVDTMEPGSVSVIWADYCCTWGGNDQVRPRQDMQLLVERGILRAGGAVFVTTTLQHVSREDSMQAMHEMDHEVFKGWMVDAPRVYASGQMLFKRFRSNV